MDLTTDNFGQEILDFKGVALVDFWAAWCGPCKAIAPVINEIGFHYQNKAKIAKLNIDQNSAIASTFGITSIPTILIFKNGKIVDRLVGALPKQTIEKRLNNFL